MKLSMRLCILLSFFLFQMSHAEMRGRVQMANGNVVSDTGQPLRYEGHKTDILYLIDKVVQWAEEDGIYAIVNLHTRFGTTTELNRMKDFWEVMAPRYKDKTHVVYELTNEPKTQFWTDTDFGDRGDRETNDSNLLIDAVMADLYTYVRGLAPETHLILWSPNNPSALTVDRINAASDGIDYSNASVGFHIYEYTLGKAQQWDLAQEYRDAGYPTILTEFYSLSAADHYPIDYAHLITNIKTAESRGI